MRLILPSDAPSWSSKYKPRDWSGMLWIQATLAVPLIIIDLQPAQFHNAGLTSYQ